MERKAVSGIMLTLLLTGMLTLAFNIQPAKASGTIHIRADGSVDPPTAPIQRDGDVYTFTDNIYDSIVVKRDDIVVDGAGYTVQGIGDGKGIDLSGRSNVTIKNIEIKAFDFGIWLKHSSNNSISGNNIIGNLWGIWLSYPSNYNSISGNNVTTNNSGIRLYDSSNYNSILGNNVTNNYVGIELSDRSNYNSIFGNNVTANEWYGIRLSYSSNNVLRGNVMAGNKYNFGVLGRWLSHFMNNVDASNTVDGKPIFYLINEQNLIIDPQTYPSVGYLALINCTNITVEDLTLTSNRDGLLLAYTKNSSIQNVTIMSNMYGINLYWSTYNSISENNIANNDLIGIYFDHSSYNNISGNNITANNQYGIWIYYSSSYNSVSGNNVTNNDLIGIELSHRSNYNSILGNNINNNGNGIVLHRSFYSIIYHNNFVDNTEQVYSYESRNVWDDGYPSGGNYWSDYEERYPDAEELDGSGIWDTPYVIDENNQDNFPLMEPWSPTPPSPVEATQELIEIIETWNLSKGVQNSLTPKLDNVIHLLDKENKKGATHKLMVFINQVETLEGKKLTSEQVNYLISEAQRIIDLINEMNS